MQCVYDISFVFVVVVMRMYSLLLELLLRWEMISLLLVLFLWWGDELSVVGVVVVVGG